MPCLIPFFNPALGNKIDVLVMGKERWFRVADIARALCYCDYGDSITARWSEEIRTFTQKDIAGVNLGARAVRFITSDGLLAFLISCPRPMAQILRRWIIDVVMPSIDFMAFDIDTGQSALDKAILNELDALKKSHQDIRRMQERQMVDSIQRVAEAILSWVDNAPANHVQIFQEAFQKVEDVSASGS